MFQFNKDRVGRPDWRAILREQEELGYLNEMETTHENAHTAPLQSEQIQTATQVPTDPIKAKLDPLQAKIEPLSQDPYNFLGNAETFLSELLKKLEQSETELQADIAKSNSDWQSVSVKTQTSLNELTAQNQALQQQNQDLMSKNSQLYNLLKTSLAEQIQPLLTTLKTAIAEHTQAKANYETAKANLANLENEFKTTLQSKSNKIQYLEAEIQDLEWAGDAHDRYRTLEDDLSRLENRLRVLGILLDSKSS